MVWRGIPEHVRSDQGPEFVAWELRKWLGEAGHRDSVHRTGKPLGERVCGVVQREVRRRVLEWRERPQHIENLND